MSTLILILSVYGIINIYIASWFWRNLAENEILRPVICLAIIVLAIGFPIFAKLNGSSALEIALVRITSFWVVIFIYLFLMVLILDILSIFKYKFNITYVLATMFCLLFIILLTGWINARNPVLNTFNLNIKTEKSVLEQMPQKTFTIAVFSDTHLGINVPTESLDRAVNLVNGEKLDAVLFLGDIIDDHVLVETEEINKSILKLNPNFGTWGILGNHEYISGEIQTSINLIEKSGIKLLRDNWTILGNSIVLVGRDEYSSFIYSNTKRSSLKEILKTNNTNLPIIILDHQPRNLAEAEEINAVLQLSGHTHNGQFWPINLIVAQIFENPYGHSVRGNTNYIVSVGTMTWGPPVRNTARPEVILLKINFISQ